MFSEVSMSQTKSSLKRKNGFTLVELMIVVLVVSILSGFSLSLINRGQQKNRAQDAVVRANLEKAVSAIQSYYYGEGAYPVITGATTPGDPFSVSGSNPSLGVYLKTWPVGFVYLYSSPSDFAVYVKRNADANYYKFRTTTEAISLCASATPNLLTQVSTCTVIGE
jgi:prepilin-type N-terminal cleavage/methylation domain-containing protein